MRKDKKDVGTRKPELPVHEDIMENFPTGTVATKTINTPSQINRMAGRVLRGLLRRGLRRVSIAELDQLLTDLYGKATKSHVVREKAKSFNEGWHAAVKKHNDEWL